jgi:hypothetical protein
MKEKNLYKIGEKLGITEAEIKTTLKRNRKKIIAGALVIITAIVIGNSYFLGMHYAGISIKDLNLLSRFF